MTVLSISDVVKRRNITEIVHFTSNHGLLGTLEVGAVLSRRQLPEIKHLANLAAPTSAQRQEAMSFFDKKADWLDFVNLSISEINQHYFNVASTKWHVQGDRWWTILAFRPSILEHEGVYFTTTNNVYEYVKRNSGVDGLTALFSPVIPRKPKWAAYRGSRPDHVPTCQQAELLYPHSLSIEDLFRVYVRTDEEHDVVSGWLRFYRRPNIEVVISPEKFAGMPN